MPARTRDKRKRRRARTRHAAQIRTSDSPNLLPCVLWDLSDKGARIAAAYSNKLPAVFKLLQAGQEDRICRIVWRKGSMVGVRFLEQGEHGEELAAAPTQPSYWTKAAGPTAATQTVSLPSWYVVPVQRKANAGGHAVSITAGILFIVLLMLTALLFIADEQSGAGIAWAGTVCQQANGLCAHSGLGAAASGLMALVYMTTKGMEL